MFKQENGGGDPKKIETIIGPSIKVKGNFNGQGNTVVEGVLEGSLKTDAHVFVGNNAKVKANIDAKTAKIGGAIEGNIKTAKGLEITQTARISGDIYCGDLSVESGAIINGQCIMNKEADKINKNTNGSEDKKAKK